MKRNVLLLALALCVLGPPAAMAQSNLGLDRIGAAIGFVSPEGLDGTLGLGILADHGTLAPRIGLESHLDYWSWSEQAFGTEASVSDIAIGARGKYYFEVSHSNLRPFAGAGLGLHFIHSEIVIQQPFGFPEMRADDSSTKLGLDLGGGIAAPLGPRTDFLGELWYGVVTDISNVSLRVGLSYRLNP